MAEHPDAVATPPAARHRWWYCSPPGLWVAVIAVCLSLTPSLLPRSGLIQGLVCGIAAAIGYGLGVVGAWAWRAIADRDARTPQPRTWWLLAAVGGVALVGSLLLGRHWQGQIRALMGVPPDSPVALVVVPVVALVTFAALLGISRGLRRVYRWLARLLGRWIGPRAARALGWAVVVVGTALLFSGVVLDGLVAAADQAFSVRNAGSDDGIARPDAPERAGSPSSMVAWESLGREGRNFSAKGPTPAEITAFTGAPAPTPIRAYAGLESADSAEERAQLAVADLERAGGFTRGTLVVITTTGSGWIDPAAIDSLEYITGGDSAAVTIQYSYLPSWISYLVDQDRAREAGRALFDAVYDRWTDLPVGSRPRLLVAGESLGSFGAETAFSGEHDLSNRTDGVVFTGPPNFNTLYREFVDGREPGTPEIAPIYRDGRTVRFSRDAVSPIASAGQPWDGSRVLYVQHPSDPIVWWSPQLILNRPDWLTEPRGDDVLDAVVWIPLLTFWQVTADLPFAVGVPPGHGHVYVPEYVDAWATVLQPPGWIPQRAEQLKPLISYTG
ncbi:alpha/beta hydrolase [Pseudonocardia sp.]|uniref:alpha/beta hydrolase n=1 Tax=Pseudonocardia sp. TaxID=60912 RepID=UPI003D14B10A